MSHRLTVDIDDELAAALAAEQKHAPFATTRSAVAREALRDGLGTIRARRASIAANPNPNPTADASRAA